MCFPQDTEVSPNDHAGKRLVYPEEIVLADPYRNAGDRSYDETVGGEQFTLYIQGSAEEISGYDSEERENADERFHGVLLFVVEEARILLLLRKIAGRSRKIGLRGFACVNLEDIVRLDPRRDTGDGRDNEQISGN